jgi:hypothetical protein
MVPKTEAMVSEAGVNDRENISRNTISRHYFSIRKRRKFSFMKNQPINILFKFKWVINGNLLRIKIWTSDSTNVIQTQNQKMKYTNDRLLKDQL